MDIQNAIRSYKQAKIDGQAYVSRPEITIEKTIWSVHQVEPEAISIENENTIHLALRAGDILQADLKWIYNEEERRKVLENIDAYTYASERVEIQDREKLKPYQNYTISFDLKLPKGFPKIDNRLIVGQRRQTGKKNHARCIGQSYREGKFHININNSGSKVGNESENQTLRTSNDDFLGTWHHIEYNIRFSDQEDGYLRVTIDDTQVINQEHLKLYINNDPDFDDSFYFKFGLYRNNYMLGIKKLREKGEEDKIPAIQKAIQEEEKGNPMNIYFKNYKKIENI